MRYIPIVILLSFLFSACHSSEKKKEDDNNSQKQFIEPPKHNKDTGQVYLIYPQRNTYYRF